MNKIWIKYNVSTLKGSNSLTDNKWWYVSTAAQRKHEPYKMNKQMIPQTLDLKTIKDTLS